MWQKGLLALALVLGCQPPAGWTPLRTNAKEFWPESKLAFVPGAPNEWPLWPTGDGWLIGGSGYVTGLSVPFGVAPGLGLGALLLSSRLEGRLYGLPLPSPKQKDEEEKKASPSPAPTPLPSPPVGFLLTPWGEVKLKAGPELGAPYWGFPPADGTPVSEGDFQTFIRVRGDDQDSFLFETRSRNLFRPSTFEFLGPFVDTSERSSVVLVSLIGLGGPLALVDLLTGAFDSLDEMEDVTEATTGSMSRDGWFIAYAAGEPGKRRIHLFDRGTRMVNRLAHLATGDEVFDPELNLDGRWLFLVRAVHGQLDLALYDTVTGHLDPLPRANSSADDYSPSTDGWGHSLAFITERTGVPEARIYDRGTQGLDSLPEVNALGPILQLSLTSDGRYLYVVVPVEGGTRAYRYDRVSRFIDSLPEVNLAGAVISL